MTILKIEKLKDGWALVVDDNEAVTDDYELVLRSGMKKWQAEALRRHVKQAIEVKFTGPCGYCGGIGGCYMCDS